jgi:MFS family permease
MTMTRDWRALFTFNRDIRLFMGAWALIAFGYFGVQGVLLNLYLLRLGFDAQFIGAMTASGQIVWALAALPAGALGQRLGLRAALITGSACAALGLGLLLGVEGLPQALWVPWLYLAWSVMWVGAALLTVNSIPYLLSISPAGQSNYAFAAQGAVMALLGFAGSVVAGVLPAQVAGWLNRSLDQPAPYGYPLWLVPLAHLVCVGLWSLARPVKPVLDRDTHSAGPRPLGLFFFLGIIVFLQTAGEGAVRAFFTIYLDQGLHLFAAPIGLIYGTGQLLPIFMALMTPRLLSRWGTARVLAWTSLGACLASLPLAAVHDWAAASLGFLGWMSMLAVMGPSRSIFSQEIVTPRWHGTTAAVATVGIGLGWASTALAGGYLIARVGFAGVFWLSAALALMAALLAQGYVQVRASRSATEAYQPIGR